MFKKKFKFILFLFFILFFISSICLATSDDASTANETVTNEISETTADESTVGVEEDSNAIYGDDYSSINPLKNSNFKYEEKRIDGNTFLIGNEITIDTDLYGDLFVIAKKLTITERSRVCGNLFVVAIDVNIDGLTYDLYAKCKNLYVGPNGAIYRNLYANADRIKMYGQVGRDMNITSNDLEFTGKDPETNTELAGTVYGKLKYDTVKNVVIPQGTVKTENGIIPVTSNSNTLFGHVISGLSAMIYVAIIYLATLWIAPQFINKITEYVPKKLFVSFGLGVFMIVAISLLATGLYFSVVATSLSFILFGILGLLFLLSSFVVCAAVGTFISRKLKGKSKYIALGFSSFIALLIWSLSFIPYVGFAILIIVTILGTGIFTLTLFRKKELKKEMK